MIATRLYENHPPRYEYFLTDKGKALGPVLKALYNWGERYRTARVDRACSQIDSLREHKPLKSDSHRFCVAPMMEWTDRHCRYFLRLISRRTFLYTEMVTADAVLYGDRERVLGFSPEEHPVGLQLGGSDPDKLAEAARIGADFGYDEINLNIGCPSDRVQSGRFGACLMAEPDLVADCVAAMGEAAALPVTVKCRIGIDDQDAEESLDRFIDSVAQAGCGPSSCMRARPGSRALSPKENRDIPPLDYVRVYRLKQRRPDLEIVINGGIESFDEAHAHLPPCRRRDARPRRLCRSLSAGRGRSRVVRRERAGRHRGSTCSTRSCLTSRPSSPGGARLNQMTRHILGLFHGQPRARAFRRHLAENAHLDGAGIEVLRAARSIVAGEGVSRSPPSRPR